MQAVVTRARVCGMDTEIRLCGKGRPILYLHSGDGIRCELDFVKKLSSLGQVHAPSHPGFGNSERPDDFKTVEDLAYFYLDYLEQSGLSDVLMVGASFGGWIACEIAVRSTQRLSKLVLLNTVGARFSDRDAEDIADIYMLPDNEKAALSYFNPDNGKLDIATSSDEDLIEVSRNRIALCQYAWSPYMNNPRLKRWLHRINVPVHLIWGAQDRIVPPEYGRKFAAEISDTRFTLIDQAGHFPHVEQSDAVMRLIQDFIAMTPSPAMAAT